MAGAPFSGRVRAVRAHRSPLRGVALLAATLGEAINATCLDGAVPATLWVPRRRLRCTLVRGTASVDGNEPARRAAELFMPVGPRQPPSPGVSVDRSPAWASASSDAVRLESRQ